MVQLGHVWTQVGLSMRNDRPNVGNMALHKPPKPKKVEITVSVQVFSLADWVCKIGRIGPSCRKGAQLGPKFRYLEPNWAEVGANWSCWVEVGPKVMQVDRKLKPCDAHGSPKWCNLGPCGNSFAPSWAQRRHNMGSIASFQWKRFEDFGLGRLCPPLWSHIKFNLGQSCSQMGPQVVPSWSQLGPKLEPSGSKLGRSRGRSWPQVLPMLRPCRIETVHSGNVGPICNMWKLRQWEPSFLAPGRSWKCPAEADRSVHSYHSLLNYHALAPVARADFAILFRKTFTNTFMPICAAGGVKAGCIAAGYLYAGCLGMIHSRRWDQWRLLVLEPPVGLTRALAAKIQGIRGGRYGTRCTRLWFGFSNFRDPKSWARISCFFGAWFAFRLRMLRHSSLKAKGNLRSNARNPKCNFGWC